MISLSLGFDQVDPGIADAVKHAHGQDVVMLAAASNPGGNKSMAFPANIHHSVLAINSTDGEGNPSTFNPTDLPGNENFSVLGFAVESAWPKSLGGGLNQRKAGTSFATPIAAGISAVLLKYAMVMPETFSSRKMPSGRSGTPDKIRAMLLAIADRRAQYAYLAPVKFFNERSEIYARESLGYEWNRNI